MVPRNQLARLSALAFVPVAPEIWLEQVRNDYRARFRSWFRSRLSFLIVPFPHLPLKNRALFYGIGHGHRSERAPFNRSIGERERNHQRISPAADATR